jgi:hypothetical protein
MFKVFLTVRNRLSITKKCIQALQKHSELPFQLYVYDNSTNYLVKEHFLYFSELYEKGIVTQVTFNTDKSTFGAFSKAVASNQFAKLHLEDPEKDNYSFLLLLDNDIIVTPGFDKTLRQAWKNIKKLGMNNIKIVGQLPGGIKGKKLLDITIAGFPACEGKLGGSGLWGVQSNFFEDVGLLDLKKFVNQNKRHDQEYWHLTEKSTNGRPYILGLKSKLGIHCGTLSGSICNTLSRDKNNPKRFEIIKFKEQEKIIDNMSFDEFYKKIINNKVLNNDW